jgi:hypothetical protein
MRYINGTRLDDRIIRTDWDAGFIEGRQYGRGKTGGQVCFDFIHHMPNFSSSINELVRASNNPKIQAYTSGAGIPLAVKNYIENILHKGLT